MDNNNGHIPPKVKELLQAKDKLSAEELRELNWWELHRSEIPPEPGDPWQIFTLADAYQERPPVEYIAAGLFALPSLNIVYGAPGTLKSFILADLCVCVSAGLPWLPMAPWQGAGKGYPTKQAPAVWIDFDNGRRRTHDRFAALGRARDLPANVPLYYYSMPNPWLNANDKESVGGLINRIKACSAQLVVIDNLGVVSGDAEENSSGMAQVMSGFRQLAEDTGAAVVLIHHQRKGNGTIGRAGDTLRGHSSIEAALDLALLIEREEYADSLVLKPTKVRGADVLPFSAQWTYENQPGSTDQLLTAKFFGLATEDTQSDKAIEREILAALEGQRMNQTELKKAVYSALEEKVSLRRILSMIAKLTGDKIHTTAGENNAKIYARI